MDIEDTTENQGMSDDSFNHETDCPICFSKMSINKIDNSDYNPDSDNEDISIMCDRCRSAICMDCYMIVYKCAICRDSYNKPDEPKNKEVEIDFDILLTGTNLRPQYNLFLGRRWFNVDTNKIEIYSLQNWVESNSIDTRMCSPCSDFMSRMINITTNRECCNGCGIQMTQEVNNAYKTFYNNEIPSIPSYDDDIIMEHYFDMSDDLCHACLKRFHFLITCDILGLPNDYNAELNRIRLENNLEQVTP